MRRFILLLLAVLFLAGCSNPIIQKVNTKNKPASPAVSGTQTENLKVHFLDVGQGDSILVQFPDGKNMLVDAGANESAPTIINYLNSNGIKRLDYLVGTHPHEDHIGSLDAVINHFEIGEVLMPKATTNTKTFRDVLAAIKNKRLRATTAKAGVSVISDGNLSVDILGPCGDTYESLNNYSAVIKIKYGDVAFLLTGDAEALSEQEILAAGADVRAQVLKVGHHGSESSTSAEFLKAVNSEYAVISVGAGNDYHHPHQVILNKLRKAVIKVLRTDQIGTIVFSTDGRNIYR
ncbi:ComEC/Rec2 family competence protein [Pelotomaculum sp. PtaB.Bin117]|uniref:ComEC/Rec2 family competence protein n=1 Tax=Pelotomaculum sp. PtaB.Bin117 TaxID=1811694 RepID=UPI0009CF10B3|nr:ComEC/Rec2 family competence protein [Pelotomaculum sp. PtaB.Bin117]OPX85767.1 MAG: ComEC family competence protein [Pelotomaculum sp. PtaB.Bin117]